MLPAAPLGRPENAGTRSDCPRERPVEDPLPRSPESNARSRYSASRAPNSSWRAAISDAGLNSAIRQPVLVTTLLCPGGM